MSAQAVVLRSDEVTLAQATGHPAVIWRDRAIMPCGCVAMVGVRIDTTEWAVVSSPCEGGDHTEQMHRFLDMFAEALLLGEAFPGMSDGLDCVMLAAELLSRAFNEPGGS